MSKILIAGCGELGRGLGKALCDAHHTVLGISRSQQLAAPLISLQADLSELASLKPLKQEIDCIFFTASADSFSKADYKKAYLDSVANLLKVFEDSAKQFVFISSTSVYPHQHGEIVTEETLCKPAHFSGSTLLAAEQLVLKSQLKSLVLRCSGIYGPGRLRLIQSIKTKTATLSATPLYTNRIHIEDIIGAILHLMQQDKTQGIYNLTDDEPALKNDVLSYIAALLEQQTPPMSEQASHPLRGNKRVSNEKLKATGFKYRYPTYREGYQAILNIGS